MSEKNIVFRGRKLGEIEFRNLMKFDSMRELVNSLPKPVEITILDPSTKIENFAIRTENRSTYFSYLMRPRQRLVSHTDFDKKIIQLSQVTRAAREVGLIRILGKNKRALVSSDYFLGSEREISAKSLRDNIEKALDRYTVNSVEQGVMTAIEISHTHPFYERKIRTGNTWTYNLFYLNDNDLSFAERISADANNVVIIIRAVLPNGYCYESYFLNGADITNEIQ